MADELASQNLPKKLDLQEKPVSGGVITPSQEQLCLQLEAPLPDRLPQSLVEWLARTLAPAASAGVNPRYMALNQEKVNDTS